MAHPQIADARARTGWHGTGFNHGGHYPAYSYYGASRRFAWYGHRRSYTSLRNWASSGLQCVPFARENSGIELSGNAVTWWDKADGLYARGARPEVGGILNFRATGRMRMGHVAVVTNVLDGRHIQIDHANWGARGAISRDIDVVDVSSSNDWTAVRVELGHTNEFGSVYPTYGFIYDRPDEGTMVANAGITAAPMLNAAPADLRPAGDRIESPVVATAPEEVAEASDDGEDTSGVSYPRHSYYRHYGRYSHRIVAYPRAKGHVAFTHTVHSAGVYRVSSTAANTSLHHRRSRF